MLIGGSSGTEGFWGELEELRQGPAQVATLVQALILMGDWCVLATVKRDPLE